MNDCKYCQSEKIEHLVDQEVILYKDSELNISTEYSICHQCNREFLSKQQILHNDTQLRDAKKALVA